MFALSSPCSSQTQCPCTQHLRVEEPELPTQDKDPCRNNQWVPSCSAQHPPACPDPSWLSGMGGRVSTTDCDGPKPPHFKVSAPAQEDKSILFRRSHVLQSHPGIHTSWRCWDSALLKHFLFSQNGNSVEMSTFPVGHSPM